MHDFDKHFESTARKVTVIWWVSAVFGTLIASGLLFALVIGCRWLWKHAV